MRKIKQILGTFALVFASVANATLIPIDSDLFTVVLSGTQTWSDNNLTLSIAENEPGDAAVSLYLPDPLEKAVFLHIQLSRKQTLKIAWCGSENGQQETLRFCC
jgi:hypothetical protein